MNIPVFPGAIRKNDALFMYGARETATTVLTYEQMCVEIVHGPSCDPEKEINLDGCKDDNVPILERRGGGGTVVLSPGMVITVITGTRTKKETPLELFHRIHSAMIDVFCKHSITCIIESGISDLSINNRKVAGSSLYMGSNPLRYYYQSSLMVVPDLLLLDRYLKHPPREPDYRSGRSHTQFCTTLNTAGFDVSTEDVCRWLSEEIRLP